ncbi:MAG: hypothetical protein SFU53_14500 [Terrimicrobiaceae bacterium]|nr:hypothetical protein [Terrimicrobiaceae bacterium]
MKTRTVVVLLLALIGWIPDVPADVMAATDNVRILFSRNRSVSDVKGGSIGEKLAAFEPSVKITNGSFRGFTGNRACVILMGEDATRKDNWRVIFRREFEFDLPASKTHEWIGEPFEQGFDRTMVKSGYDYDGYIVLIRNSDGKIVQSAATKAFWIGDLEKAWSLQEGNDYPKLHFR